MGQAYRRRAHVNGYTRPVLKPRRTDPNHREKLPANWPKDTLARLNVKEGDELFVIETANGVLVTPFDPKFKKSVETARKIMARDRDALKELAK